MTITVHENNSNKFPFIGWMLGHLSLHHKNTTMYGASLTAALGNANQGATKPTLLLGDWEEKR